MFNTPRHVASAALAAALMFAVQACTDEATGPAPGKSRVQILLTDAPADLVTEARVWISKVYLQGVDDNTPRVYLLNAPDNPREFDLLKLRNGITVELTPFVDIDPGDYHQLRVVVDSAAVTLAEGLQFEDGNKRKRFLVPASMTNGIRVALDVALAAQEGRTTKLTIDCDVNRSFVISGVVGAGAGTHTVTFEPWMIEKAREILD